MMACCACVHLLGKNVSDLRRSALPVSVELNVAPLLAAIAAQAAAADSTRSVSPEVLRAIKGNAVMRMSASREIGGLEIGRAHV